MELVPPTVRQDVILAPLKGPVVIPESIFQVFTTMPRGIRTLQVIKMDSKHCIGLHNNHVNLPIEDRIASGSIGDRSGSNRIIETPNLLFD
jgi:hypothetical protein